jgi:hypothetical protein
MHVQTGCINCSNQGPDRKTVNTVLQKNDLLKKIQEMHRIEKVAGLQVYTTHKDICTAFVHGNRKVLLAYIP